MDTNDNDPRNAAHPLALACLTEIENCYDTLDSDDRAYFIDQFDPESDDQIVAVAGMEFWIMDDTAADSAWDESLENYLDECVAGADGPYFDREAWKRDARFDGRGHCLNGYDGNEIEACWKDRRSVHDEITLDDGTRRTVHDEDVEYHWRYIYRTN